MKLSLRAYSLRFFISLIVTFVTWSYFSTPSVNLTKKRALGSDHFLYDSNGLLLQQLRMDFKKRRLPWVSIEEFSPALLHTLLKSEDKRFYSHIGVDFIALARAFRNLIEGKTIQGASTITMQVTDLINSKVLVHNEKIKKGSIPSKINQIFRALALDLYWSKKQIFEAYVNLIHLRGEFQGVHTFSRVYFNKLPNLIDNSEALVIAALIKSPNTNFDNIKKNTCILGKRVKTISCEKIDATISQVLSRPNQNNLLNEYNYAPHLARRLFTKDETSIVRTTVRRDLQNKVREILEKNVYHVHHRNVNNSAAVVLDNKSGNVLAYVGSVEKFSKAKYVDVANSPRPAGSTLKPFIYGRAIEKKYITASSVISDDPSAISWAGGVYRPRNYDSKFHGLVSVRQSLGSSLNVPAVKTVKILGLHSTYQLLNSLGFQDMKAPDFYGASLALGALDVRLLELTNAYRALANNGLISPVNFFKTSDQKTDTRKILSKEASFIVSMILSDPDARRIGFGWDNPLETGFWTAVKTGTSKGLRDNWCIGFSDQYTVGIWTGNSDFTRMDKLSGVTGAAPSWNEIMKYLHFQNPSNPPDIPENIIAKKIIPANLTHAIKEYYIQGTEPLVEKIQVAKNRKFQFVFPANNSTLVIDPQIDPKKIGVFIRFKGNVPEGATLKVGEVFLGKAKNPTKWDYPLLGEHRLSLLDAQGKELEFVEFTVKGKALPPR